MKKDRNCGVPYPIYPPYQGMMPMGMQSGMQPGMMMQPGMNQPMMNPPMMNQTQYSQVSGTIEQQLSSLNSQVSSLEKRVSSLESLVGNKYNSSNFQVM